MKHSGLELSVIKQSKYDLDLELLPPRIQVINQIDACVPKRVSHVLLALSARIINLEALNHEVTHNLLLQAFDMFYPPSIFLLFVLQLNIDHSIARSHIGPLKGQLTLLATIRRG